MTAGSKYMDIDAYAGCIAYAELLRAQGESAQAVSTAPLNQSITKTLRSWDVAFGTTYSPSPDNKFILIDISEAAHFEKFVDLDRVDEIIDHHPGTLDFWLPRIGQRACIEDIGAACTLVYERWKQAGLTAKMSLASARLLATGILDNTLNFKAAISTTRDKLAYDDLATIGQLGSDWPAQYFHECQEAIEANLENTIEHDTKILEATPKLPAVMAQLVVWDGSRVWGQYSSPISRILDKKSDSWWVSIISITEGRNYIAASNTKERAKITKLLGGRKSKNLITTDRLWLRKEIIKAAQ